MAETRESGAARRRPYADPYADPHSDPQADPHGEPYLLTRFAVPALPGTFLRRGRLTAHLDEAARTPLTMVNGPAGAGKTLLVADWVAGRAEPVAWLTIGDGDLTTDATEPGPGMWWAYLLQALRLSGVPLPPDIGCPADANRADPGLLTRLAAHLGTRERPVTVVLDEFDRVTDPRFAEQLAFVLHHAGPGLRLVLVTRTEPLLPLHRYRAAGELTEIRGAELAFTPAEATALLERHGMRLPPAAVRALVDRTRGWAAGLRLSALAAREHPDPETYLKEFEARRTTVADFLLAEVLERQSPETQDLLLRAGVLDRFCPALVNALTGRADAAAVLAELHRENAFVEDLGRDQYRLHPLFREILRAHLRVRSPGLEQELHRRAAHWLHGSAAGSLEETLAHGAAAQDWDFTAGALVDDLAIGQLFTGLRRGDLTELFAAMPPDAAGPAVDLVRAARALSLSDADRGLTHLRRAEDRLGEDTAGRAAARLSCALLEALAARLTGAPDRAGKAADAAGELRREVPARLLDEHPELFALLLAHVGSAHLWAGRFGDARTALSRAAGTARGPATPAAPAATPTPATALPREDALGGLALIDYLDGRLDRAERNALASLSVTERFGPPHLPGSALARLVLAGVAVERHELATAQRLLDTTAAAPAHGPPRDPVTEAGRAVVTARLLLARGGARAVLDALEREPGPGAGLATATGSPWADGATALAAAAAHLAEGRPEAAVGLLRTVPDDWPAGAAEAAGIRLAAEEALTADRTFSGVRAAGESFTESLAADGATLRLPDHAGPGLTVRAMLARARAADRVGDRATACRLVAKALYAARRERVRRPFFEAGPWIRPLLGTAPLQGLADGWLDPHRAAPAGAPRTGEPPPVVEELSGRERDVLRRLAQLMSTDEIAADLHVSPNTVKTHLKSVYRKLAVSRRNDAVRRAREHHLL
ncbi:LuxR C-terminal-related transcriptional regulator [Streptomyces ficellus]|uniref:Helix-turn-helix transcriptional regulator n=1 Tax=Streptomyces ficellus TaxID=1977088 RepID=A0A6I6FDV0_9ACTN|nr:LuxR C-terminal-related transcriptional regulator [Streptomyces ficellus]QGV77255.1 helix-turn-helix transcriptional regulator [Streptomyces ficellus]